MNNKNNTQDHAFTLVEILLVVALLGILAAVAVGMFGDQTQNTRQTAFVTSIKTFARLARLYQVENGQWPADADSGEMPAGWDRYVNAADWTGESPIGGAWDIQRNAHGFDACLGVHFNSERTRKNDAYMTDIDAMLDDGDLQTGRFRKVSENRYCLILAE